MTWIHRPCCRREDEGYCAHECLYNVLLGCVECCRPWGRDENVLSASQTGILLGIGWCGLCSVPACDRQARMCSEGSSPTWAAVSSSCGSNFAFEPQLALVSPGLKPVS